jgi:16S rRNA (guanine1207-N2)-methyltransferase
VATDNNAAALIAMRRNAEHHGLAVEVVATDGAQGIDGPFDLVLCNPPFHQGFTMEDTLTARFLADTAQVLSPQGAALFVVNAFIGLEKEACKHFKQVSVLAHNRSFKLVRLSQ